LGHHRGTPRRGKLVVNDFPSLQLEALALSSQGKDGATLYLDALGFRVTTNQACPPSDPADVLATIPLTDTYPAGRFDYISAVPAPTGSTRRTGYCNGTTWGRWCLGKAKL